MPRSSPPSQAINKLKSAVKFRVRNIDKCMQYNKTLFLHLFQLVTMTSIADSMRLTIESIKATYGDNLPTLDTKMYEERSYTMAAAACYAAAYAAAAHYRDNMALQFFRHALLLSDALAPEYPKETDKDDNVIERPSEKQLALDSELQASQMGIASRYGLLTYLSHETEEWVFINLYRSAHKACMAAHNEAKAMRHSPIDVDFTEAVMKAAEAIGVYYNNELAIWTTAVQAREAGSTPTWTPNGMLVSTSEPGEDDATDPLSAADVFIAESPEQRSKHSQAQLNTLFKAEQMRLATLIASRDAALVQLKKLNVDIAAQAEVAEAADRAFEDVKEQMDKSRKTLEESTGKLSRLGKERGDLRVQLACTDSDYNRLSERLQTIVNMRARAGT